MAVFGNPLYTKAHVFSSAGSIDLPNNLKWIRLYIRTGQMRVTLKTGSTITVPNNTQWFYPADPKGGTYLPFTVQTTGATVDAFVEYATQTPG